MGGAGRFLVELSEALARRHHVRVLALADPGAAVPAPAHARWQTVTAPPPAGGRWQTRARRRAALKQGLERALEEELSDVLVGQHDTGPAVVAAARGAGRPAVLLLPSYEALCLEAFIPGNGCIPESRCRACPQALSLAPAERRALHETRDAHAASLPDATALVAPARSLAAATEEWTGRMPYVIAPVVGMPSLAEARPDGHVLAVAALWDRNKGVEMLAPLAARLGSRRVVVQYHAGGLPARWRRGLEELPNVTLHESPASERPRFEGAAVVIVPTLMDVFSRVAFEAMAAGAPTLASAAGGLPEVVPAQQLVPRFEEADAWADAVRELEDQDAWEAARRRGREAAEAILATRPVERLEEVLVRAAAVPAGTVA